MVAYNKFNQFVQDLCLGVHNFSNNTSAVLTVALANLASTPSTSAANLAAVSQISSYSALTTRIANITSCAQSSGTLKLIVADQVLTANATTPVFDNIILYNANSSALQGNALICFWTYGSDISLANNETFTIDYDNTNGVLQIS